MTSLQKNAFIYLLANIAVASVPFFLLPILTRYLGPEGYGIVSLFTTVLPLIGAFVGLSVHGAVSRRWFDKDEINIAEYTSGCLAILVTSAMIFVALFSLFDLWVAERVQLPVKWLYVAILVSFSSFIIQIRLVLWQVSGQAIKYGLMQFSNALLNGVISLVFVVVLLSDYEGRLVGHSFAFVFFALVSMAWLVKDRIVTFNIRITYIKDALKFGVPLIPHVIGGFLLLLADRIIVNDHLGPESVGIYMVAVQIALAMQLINEAFNKAFAPWLFERLKKGCHEAKLKIVKYTYLYFIVLLLTVPIAYISAHFVITLLAGEKFQDAAEVLPLLVLAQAFHGMYYLVTNYLFYECKTHITASITIISGCIGICITWFMVSNYGLLGAGVGASIAMFLQFTMTWIMAAKVHPMPWFFKLSKVQN